MDGGTLMEPEEIFEQYRRNAAFYTKGGITVTGGEPLMQFAAAAFSRGFAGI